MGTSSSSLKGDEHTSEHSKQSDPNFRFLIGKVKNLGPAAQRLFNLGKLYLSPDDQAVSYTHLTLPTSSTV